MPLTTRRLRIALIMNRIIKEQFTDLEWTELATLTDGEDIVYQHPRFQHVRYYSNEDEYIDEDLETIKQLLDRNEENLGIICDYLNLSDWLKRTNPREYARLFESSQHLLGELHDRAVANSFELHQYILRIQDGIDADPELAIGSMKDLLESVMKQILEAHEFGLTGKENFPQLLKRTQKTLHLDPSDLDERVKGRDLIVRILSSLGSVARDINELRNIYGSGKGRASATGVTPRHARLVVNAGAALAVFLIETFEHHQADGN